MLHCVYWHGRVGNGTGMRQVARRGSCSSLSDKHIFYHSCNSYPCSHLDNLGKQGAQTGPSSTASYIYIFIRYICILPVTQVEGFFTCGVFSWDALLEVHNAKHLIPFLILINYLQQDRTELSFWISVILTITI